MEQMISPASPSPVPPPPTAAGGRVLLPTRQSGGLTIAVIASIQKVYQIEDQKRQQGRQMATQGLMLQPGWGGQGT